MVASTHFPRKNIHKRTWTSPDHRTHNQIDHVLIEKRGVSSVMNVGTYRGANCESDHYGGIQYRCRISIRKSSKQQSLKKLQVEKLNNPELKNFYQQTLTTKLQTPNLAFGS